MPHIGTAHPHRTIAPGVTDAAHPEDVCTGPAVGAAIPDPGHRHGYAWTTDQLRRSITREDLESGAR
jgi:hypothetical protein